MALLSLLTWVVTGWKPALRYVGLDTRQKSRAPASLPATTTDRENYITA